MEIKSIEDAMRSPRSTVVAVFYKDYRTGKGIPKSRQEIDNGEEDLKILKANLALCKRRLAKRLKQAEEFIETIDMVEVRTILRMYYITGMNQDEIAEDLDLTQSRISQIINAFWMERMIQKD